VYHVSLQRKAIIIVLSFAYDSQPIIFPFLEKELDAFPVSQSTFQIPIA
jgi:hypothetical protein